MDRTPGSSALGRYADWPMTDEPLGSDFSAIRAHATLEIHMRECSERQAEVRANFITLHGRLDALMKSFDDRMAQQEKSFAERLKALDASHDSRSTAISNRMWAAAATLIVLLIGGLSVMVLRGLHP